MSKSKAYTDKKSGPDEELLFVPLGGCGEIGMNLNLFGFGRPGDHDWIMVDLGMTFPDNNAYGTEVILPDPTFIEARADRLLGIVLTHGHEDHIGAVPYLWPRLKCPIYAKPFTAELVRGKLEEAGLLGEAELRIVELGGSVSLGPFTLDYITLTHSILEPNALAVRTPLGTLFHSGDWKIDPDPMIGETTDETALKKLGEEGVLAMVCDSTNVFTPGESGSEGAVRAGLIDLVGRLEGRVAITSFASNVARVASAAAAAEAHDRHIVLVGRSMRRIVAAAQAVGYLQDFPKIVSEEDAGFLPKDKVLYLCTGSQGEPRAAMARIADGSHPHISLGQGDTVIFSSRVIPGNETGIFALQNKLVSQGIDVIADDEFMIHVSGHPCRDELATMYQWIRPEIAVPVHGEHRHLVEHAALADELQVQQSIVPENGAVMRLAPGPAEIVDFTQSGRLYLDGNVITDAEDPGFRERRKLALNGLVAVTLLLDEEGYLIDDPAFRMFGLPQEIADQIVALEEDLGGDLTYALGRARREERNRDASVEDICRRLLRKSLRPLWSKKPQLDIQIIRLETED